MTRDLRDDKNPHGLPFYVTKILEVIVREVRPIRVVLFGSYAWGTATPSSDVDLLVVAESSAPIGERGRPVEALLRDRAPRTELIWRTPEEMAATVGDPRSFVATMQRHGTVVYEASSPATSPYSRDTNST